MMEELSLNILDIAQNSVAAGASLVEIRVRTESGPDSKTIIEITDNGKGMGKELLAQVTDPFVTTRSTRKMGLGLPFFKEAAELTGGSFSIASQLGEGTRVTAVFHPNHIDMQPLGDLTGTMTSLILLNPEMDFTLEYGIDQRVFFFSTAEVREQLGPSAELNHPDVIAFLTEYLTEQMELVNGGE